MPYCVGNKKSVLKSPWSLNAFSKYVNFHFNILNKILFGEMMKIRMKFFAVCAGLVLTTLPAFAQTDLAEVQTWKPRVIEPYEYISPEDYPMYDQIVAENKRYAVIQQYGGNACPAGGFWLADKVNHQYEDLNAGSCSEELAVILTDKALVFKDGGEITAMYSLLSPIEKAKK